MSGVLEPVCGVAQHAASQRPTPDCRYGDLLVLKVGCPCRALDATGICPGTTAHDRFQEWVEAGVFERLYHAALVRYDEVCSIDWSFFSRDGAMKKEPFREKEPRRIPRIATAGMYQPRNHPCLGGPATKNSGCSQ